MGSDLNTYLDTQVGGVHYNKLGRQPLELVYDNFGYYGLRAAIYTKVNKYLLRDKGTDELDIEKAIHCLQVQLEVLRNERKKQQQVAEREESNSPELNKESYTVTGDYGNPYKLYSHPYQWKTNSCK